MRPGRSVSPAPGNVRPTVYFYSSKKPAGAQPAIGHSPQPRPLSFTDSQLDMVIAAAAVEQRDGLLRGRKPINAKCETVRTLPTFRDAYRRRRCIVPVDGFFEWKAIKGQKAKQPYAIAMKDGSPFGIGGLWENWKDPKSGEWIRTFTIITTDANELVAHIHDRMPLILAPGDYVRWLGDEPDPRDLMRQFPAEPMRMWPISTRVNKPENDDKSIVERSHWPVSAE